jgi:hypothetical protein
MTDRIIIALLGRLAYLLLGAVLMLAALSVAHAQTVTRTEFDALKAQHLSLVRYAADLATGMLRIDERRKALEAQVEAQRQLINADRVWLNNIGCNWNGLIYRLENWSKSGQFNVPPVTYVADPAQRKSCLDPTQPAPSLTDALAPWM